MANGFAMRGFTQGLTQGLQNANDLYNSYVNRDLQRAESERLRKGQETQDRWYAAQAKNMEMDNDRQERALKLTEQKGGLEITKSELDIAKERLAMEQANKQSQYPVIEAILKKDSINEDDYRKLDAFGMGPMLNMEDDADIIENLSRGVRSGEIPMDDPEVVKRLLPALTPTLNRNLGDVGRDPKTKTEVRVAVKEPIGFQRVNGKVVPILRVKGANAKGEFAEYDAPATQFASSLPDDPLLALNESAVARKLSGLAKFQRNLSKNPALRQQAQEFARSLAYGAPKPLSEKDRAYSLDKEDQIRSRNLQDQIKRLEYISSVSKGKAQEEAELALADLRREKINTERTRQGRNDALTYESETRSGNNIYGKPGLGSGRAGKTGKPYAPKVDDKKVEMWVLNDIYAKDIGAANDPQVMRQLPVLKNQLTNMMQLGDGAVSQDLAQTILYDAIKSDLSPVEKDFNGKTYTGYAYNGKFYPFKVK